LREALEISRKGVEACPGSGRLWAVHIAIVRELDGGDAAVYATGIALHSVPKSGEVWCEAAAGCVNVLAPYSSSSRNSSNEEEVEEVKESLPQGKKQSSKEETSSSNNEKKKRSQKKKSCEQCCGIDLQTALKYIDFALLFTPQYGDSIVMLIRIRLLQKIEQWVSERHEQLPTETAIETVLAMNESNFRARFRIPSISSSCKNENELVLLSSTIPESSNSKQQQQHHKNINRDKAEAANQGAFSGVVALLGEEMVRKCVGASPNYGSKWSSIKQNKGYITKEVLDEAYENEICEIGIGRDVIIAGMKLKLLDEDGGRKKEEGKRRVEVEDVLGVEKVNAWKKTSRDYLYIFE
jgi:hypothetical protein